MLKKINDLDCFGDRKSFYNKCFVLVDPTGNDENKYLLSYNTVVCYVDENNNFYRLWDGESTTTTRHVNAFLKYCNIPGGGLAWWRKQEFGPAEMVNETRRANIA